MAVDSEVKLSPETLRKVADARRLLREYQSVSRGTRAASINAWSAAWDARNKALQAIADDVFEQPATVSFETIRREYAAGFRENAK